MVNIVKPKPGMRICDPTCGSGGMLIQSRKYIEKNHPKADPEDLTLEGQESNPDTVNLCKMNLVVHGITDFEIQLGDVLEKPKLLEQKINDNNNNLIDVTVIPSTIQYLDLGGMKTNTYIDFCVTDPAINNASF